MDKGIIIYAGIDEYENELLKYIIPEVKLNIFFYNCGNKFITDIARDYLNSYNGNIVFANGETCLIYCYYNGTFQLKKHLNANLQKRQKKGGQSASRISRLAEESRHSYIMRIVDNLNNLQREHKTLMFGSREIADLILSDKLLLQPIEYSGFMEFNQNTIMDTKRWCKLLDSDSDKNDEYYKLICLYLDTNVNMLDFDIANKKDMNFYIGYDGINFPDVSSKYYEKLHLFEYIGVKYFDYDKSEDENN